MDFIELINNRQSVREYSNREVEDEKIEKCLEAARLAPSASNSQPWKLIIVNDIGLVKKVAAATFSSVVSFNKFTLQAPVLLVMVIEKPRVITQVGGFLKNREFPLIDIGIAAEHFCLQAAELGLGTCMMGWFDEKTIKKLLGIPRNKRLGLIISMGYAPEDYPLRKKIRKDKSAVVGYNKYE
jgi:nitroreductase